MSKLSLCNLQRSSLRMQQCAVRVTEVVLLVTSTVAACAPHAVSRPPVPMNVPLWGSKRSGRRVRPSYSRWPKFLPSRTLRTAPTNSQSKRPSLFLAHGDRGLSYADPGIYEQVLRRRNEIEDIVADGPSAAVCNRVRVCKGPSL